MHFWFFYFLFQCHSSPRLRHILGRHRIRPRWNQRSRSQRRSLHTLPTSPSHHPSLLHQRTAHTVFHRVRRLLHGLRRGKAVFRRAVGMHRVQDVQSRGGSDSHRQPLRVQPEGDGRRRVGRRRSIRRQSDGRRFSDWVREGGQRCWCVHVVDITQAVVRSHQVEEC